MSVSYGNLVAVHDATFSIGPGESVAIIGPNLGIAVQVAAGRAGVTGRDGISCGRPARLTYDVL